MNSIIYGAVLAATARVVSGEVAMDAKTREVLNALATAVDGVTDTVGDLSIDRPATWTDFARRLLDRTLGQKRFDRPEQWLEAEGYTRTEQRLPALWLEVCARAPSEIAYRDAADIVRRFNVEGEHFYVVHPVGEAPTLENLGSFRGPKVMLPADAERCAEVLERVGRLLWADRTGILLDSVEGTQRLVDESSAGSDYMGPLLEQLPVWARYRSAGIRRCILLQGRPGCGKSTFARTAARRLGDRTLFLSADAVSDVSATDWQLLLAVLRPEVVIVDDIDRLGEYTLATKLQMFEEGHCNVPFIFFTTNDHLELPQPMRRPGRIDQILQFDEPDEAVFNEVVHGLAKREGVTLTAARASELSEIGLRTSTAHVVELLRRAHVEGWDAQRIPEDITFGEGFDTRPKDEDRVPARDTVRRGPLRRRSR